MSNHQHWVEIAATALVATLLLAPPPPAHGQVLSALSEPSRHQGCFIMMPEMGHLFSGVKIAALNVFPRPGQSRGLSSVAPFRPNCAKNQWFRVVTSGDSGATGAKSYNQPSAVTSVVSTTSPVKVKVVATALIQSLDQIRPWLLKGVQLPTKGATSNATYGILSTSDAYRWAQKQLLKFHRSIVSVTTTFPAAISLQVSMAPPTARDLAPQFVKDHLKIVNETGGYTGAQLTYDGLVEAAGTHYFHSGRFGGATRLVVAIDNEKLVNRSVLDLSEFDLRSLAAEQYFQYFGGTSTVQETTKNQTENASVPLSTWTPTIAPNPWLLGGVLHPLTELFDRPVTKVGVAIAIKVARVRAYLAEVKEMLALTNVSVPVDSQQKLEQLRSDLKPGTLTNRTIGRLDEVVGQLDQLFRLVDTLKDTQPVAQVLTSLEQLLTCGLKLAEQCGGGTALELPKNVTTFVNDTRTLITELQQLRNASGPFSVPVRVQARAAVRSARVLLDNFGSRPPVDYCSSASLTIVECKQCARNVTDRLRTDGQCTTALVQPTLLATNNCPTSGQASGEQLAPEVAESSGNRTEVAQVCNLKPWTPEAH